MTIAKKPGPKSDYSRGKIYKITSPNTDKIYIGSTISPLRNRFYIHVRDYNKWFANNSSTYCSSYKIIKEGDAKIELIEEFPCDSRLDLQAREEYWRHQFIDIACNINRCYVNIPRGSGTEYNREYYRMRKKDDPEYLRKYNSEYYRKNRDKLSKIRRQIVKCECGCEITRGNLTTHRKSKKHAERIIELIIPGWLF